MLVLRMWPLNQQQIESLLAEIVRKMIVVLKIWLTESFLVEEI